MIYKINVVFVILNTLRLILDYKLYDKFEKM